ncbi:hypothetical protein Q0M94_28605 (plasmid) [Deinococcus radiomollis]|uniref:hypothetical protein n=1 Tax=Deinococcus radiomollis TaxID=468916 RepID=UPI0038918463
MKRYLLLALALTACAMPAIQQQPVVIQPPAPALSVPPVVTLPPVVVPPVLAVAPVIAVLAAVPPAPLTVLDASQVTVTLADSTLTIALAPNVSGVWLRLTLPHDIQSGITDTGACRCIGLGGQGPHLLNVGFLAGLSVYTSPTLDGPWTLAATTQ